MVMFEVSHCKVFLSFFFKLDMESIPLELGLISNLLHGHFFSGINNSYQQTRPLHTAIADYKNFTKSKKVV